MWSRFGVRPGTLGSVVGREPFILVSLRSRIGQIDPTSDRTDFGDYGCVTAVGFKPPLKAFLRLVLRNVSLGQGNRINIDWVKIPGSILDPNNNFDSLGIGMRVVALDRKEAWNLSALGGIPVSVGRELERLVHVNLLPSTINSDRRI